MRRTTMACLALIILATVSASGLAQTTVYDDGKTHIVNGPSGPIEVVNGSTLNINSPASVTGYFVSPVGQALLSMATPAQP